MESRIITRSGFEDPPERDINEAINELGEGWRIVHTSTAVTTYPNQPGYSAHKVYFVTVALQKD